MPFFDIPKPFVKAFVARPRKSANNVADAVEGPSSRRRPSWAKLGRPRSKGPCAARNQNHDSATDGEGAQEDAGTVDEEPAHRACGVASSSGCLRDETSSEDEGEQEDHDQEEGEGEEEEEWGYAELDDDDELAQWWSGMQGHTERRRRRPWSALMDRFSAHEEGSQGSGGSDSDETAVPTPAGSATPVENLSRSNSYKIATVLDVDRGSPLHHGLAIPAVAASLREAAVDPHGLRIVPKSNTAARAARRYDEVMDLPSFRPLHPAIAFSDEGF